MSYIHTQQGATYPTRRTAITPICDKCLLISSGGRTSPPESHCAPILGRRSASERSHMCRVRTGARPPKTHTVSLNTPALPSSTSSSNNPLRCLALPSLPRATRVVSVHNTPHNKPTRRTPLECDSRRRTKQRKERLHAKYIQTSRASKSTLGNM